MLLTITSTSSPATDLGYLLFKNPARVHGFELSFGKATVFYPEASLERCTVCLLLEVDPIGMVRRKSGPAGDGGIFGQYVNDRPYVASPFLSVAISEVFGTAMTGRSKDRPALAMTAMSLEAHIPVLPSRGGEPANSVAVRVHPPRWLYSRCAPGFYRPREARDHSTRHKVPRTGIFANHLLAGVLARKEP